MEAPLFPPIWTNPNPLVDAVVDVDEETKALVEKYRSLQKDAEIKTPEVKGKQKSSDIAGNSGDVMDMDAKEQADHRQGLPGIQSQVVDEMCQ